jgi:hypothetical protein
MVWVGCVVVAHTIYKTWSAIVFFAGILGVLLWRVVPQLGPLLHMAGIEVDAWWMRWRVAREDAALAFTWPNWLKLLWYVAALLFAVAVVSWLVQPDSIFGQVLMPTAWGFVIVVSTIDLVSWVRVALRRPTGRALGITLVSIGTALVTAVALSFARKTLFAWTGEDPGAFPASLTVLTAILVPFGWLLLGALVSAVLMFPMLLASLAQMGNTERLAREGGFHAFLVGLRPVLLCAVPMYFVSQVWTLHPKDWQPLRYAGTVTVLALDYWERPVCGGHIGLAVRLDDTHYSLLAGEKDALKFRTVTCPKKKPVP